MRLHDTCFGGLPTVAGDCEDPIHSHHISHDRHGFLVYDDFQELNPVRRVFNRASMTACQLPTQGFQTIGLIASVKFCFL